MAGGSLSFSGSPQQPAEVRAVVWERGPEQFDHPSKSIRPSFSKPIYPQKNRQEECVLLLSTPIQSCDVETISLSLCQLSPSLFSSLPLKIISSQARTLPPSKFPVVLDPDSCALVTLFGTGPWRGQMVLGTAENEGPSCLLLQPMLHFRIRGRKTEIGGQVGHCIKLPLQKTWEKGGRREAFAVVAPFSSPFSSSKEELRAGPRRRSRHSDKEKGREREREREQEKSPSVPSTKSFRPRRTKPPFRPFLLWQWHVAEAVAPKAGGNEGRASLHLRESYKGGKSRLVTTNKGGGKRNIQEGSLRGAEL